MCKKPIEVLAREVHHEPVPPEARAVVIAAWRVEDYCQKTRLSRSYRSISAGATAVSTKQVKPNQWYFVVECAKCGEAIPFLEARSPEEEPNVKQRTLDDLKCPTCGHSDTYAPALMYRDQAPGK